MEKSPSTTAPLLLRNLLTSIFIHADKPLIHLSQKYKLLQLLRCFLVSTFLFFLRLLPSLFPSEEYYNHHPSKSLKENSYSPSAAAAGDSGVERSLTQLLLLMSDIPVSSRKYEGVRSLIEKLIHENSLEKNQALTDLNCAVLSAAFARTLSQLEGAVAEQGRRKTGGDGGDVAAGAGEFQDKARSILRGIKYCGRVAWRYAKFRDEVSRSGSSAEKLAAEVLWLAQKMVGCGCGDDAVWKWASAEKLAWLGLSAEPRLQGSLVKVSAFLIKQAKELGKEDKDEEEDGEINCKTRQIKMKMLLSWLPLLCSATNGTDTPTLNTCERAELERILGEMICSLDESEQERVLSVWLQHFTYCAASDWPNLRECYTRWFSASRTRLVHNASGLDS